MSTLGLEKLTISRRDRKSTRLNSSHSQISYAVFCLKKKKNTRRTAQTPPREAAEAPNLLHASWRQALVLPHARVDNSRADRLKVPPVTRDEPTSAR